MAHISWLDRALGYRQLGQLLRAGMPLQQSLQQLGGGRAWQAHCQHAATQLASGAELTAAWSHETPFIRAVISWSERSGRLEQACQRIADSAERLVNWRRQLFGKLVYPILVLHLALLVPAIPGVVQGNPAWYLLIGPLSLWLILIALLTLGVTTRQWWMPVLLARGPLHWLVAPAREALITELLAAGIEAGMLLDELCDQAAEVMPLAFWRQPCHDLATAIRRGDDVWQNDHAWVQAGCQAATASALRVGYHSGQLVESAQQQSRLAAERTLDRLMWCLKIIAGTCFAIAIAATVYAVFSVFMEAYYKPLQQFL